MDTLPGDVEVEGEGAQSKEEVTEDLDTDSVKVVVIETAQKNEMGPPPNNPHHKLVPPPPPSVGEK